jgi:hypothetical protein
VDTGSPNDDPSPPQTVLRTLKYRALSTIRSAGIFAAAGRSRWRQNRLLILGYHGIAQDDEHRWHPSLFITPALLQSRLRFLQSADFNILPFGEAVARLRAERLPERSVAITFDDGYVDFYRIAEPILSAAGVPATLYLTTYYCENNLPIPGVTAAYMVWMSPDFTGPIRSLPSFRFNGPLNLRNAGQRRALSDAVAQYFTEERLMPADQKHLLLESFAAELQFDLDSLKRRRLMHLMTPSEVREVSARGIDIQLHTHRHWVPKNEKLVRREVEENRERIASYTGRAARHFCYPGGIHYPELLLWLRQLDIESATTCQPGLATSDDEALALPRFLDHSGVTQVEFESWLTGVASVMPRRSV